ncbi:MAG: DUF6034 family protein [Lachnospiraceae bacterium]|nr:DUF6034 family protein [Lachnospiraceae bacterium]
MKQTYLAGLLAAALGCCAIGGCATVSEASMVHPKSSASEVQAEGKKQTDTKSEVQTENTITDMTDKTDNPDQSISPLLREALDIPGQIQFSAQNESGRLQINVDAAVEVPEVSGIASVSVTKRPLTQEDVDRINDAFFPEAVFYTSESYKQMTKQECQKTIDILEQYAAEGNLDPYSYGPDYDIYQTIENMKWWRDNSPEEKTLVEVQPAFGSETGSSTEEASDINQMISVNAVLPDKTAYDYQIFQDTKTTVLINKIYERNDPELCWNWSEYQDLKGYGCELPDEAELIEKMEQDSGFTLEKARQVAEEKIEAMGIRDMELNSWDLGLLWEDGNGYSQDRQKDTGYILHYTRCIRDIPITYTIDFGGAYESLDSDYETWGYEILNFIVTEDGIDEVYFADPYNIGEAQEENLTLLPFSDILEIFKNLIIASNSFVDEYNMTRTFHIDRITLGYGRIYDPLADSSSGTLIPVWDFFGGFTDTPLDSNSERGQTTNYCPTQSHLTINAVNGSMISRSLGY